MLSSLILILLINSISQGMSKVKYLTRKSDKPTYEIKYETEEAGLDMQAVDHIIASCPDRLKKIITMVENKVTLHKSQKIIVLRGKTGVRKTELARGIAKKACIPYQFIECPLIADEYENSGVKNLFHLFEPILKDNKEEAIILDEFTTITDKQHFDHPDRDMVPAFWQIMNDFKKKKQFTLLILTTANQLPDHLINKFPESIFTLPLPDKTMRIKIAKHYLDKSNVIYDRTIIDTIAYKTGNFSGRIIEDLCDTIISNAEYRALKVNTDHDTQLIINNTDMNNAFDSLNKSLKILNYHQHSDFYSRLKQLGKTILSPTSLIVFGLGLSIYNCYKNQEKISMLHIAEENLKTIQKSAISLEQNLNITESHS